MSTDNSPLTMGQRQELFMELLPRLLDFIHSKGCKIRGGELQRSPEEAAHNAAQGDGIAHSLHIDKLAIDLNVFRNGVALTQSSDHAEFGAFWKSLHPLTRWGGDFKTRPDGNHYSVTQGGRA